MDNEENKQETTSEPVEEASSTEPVSTEEVGSGVQEQGEAADGTAEGQEDSTEEGKVG